MERAKERRQRIKDAAIPGVSLVQITMAAGSGLWSAAIELVFDTALALCLIFDVEQDVQPQPPETRPATDPPPPRKHRAVWRFVRSAMLVATVSFAAYGFYV
jgi:hypothetical protein